MFWRSIGFKLIFLIVAFSVLCVSVFVYLLDKELRSQYERDLIAQGYEIGDRVSRDIRDGMLLHGDKDTRKSLENIGYQAIVRKAEQSGTIIDSAWAVGAVLFDAEIPVVEEKPCHYEVIMSDEDFRQIVMELKE